MYMLCPNHPGLIHIPRNCMKISLTVIELCCVQDCLEKVNQRGLTRERKGWDQSTRLPDVIHISILSYLVMERTRMLTDVRTNGHCHAKIRPFYQNGCIKIKSLVFSTFDIFPCTEKYLNFVYMHGWMDDLQFYVLFNSISVISGRWADDNERLCAMEFRLWLSRFHLEWCSNPRPLDR